VGAQLRQLAGPELRRVGWISTDQTMSARMPPCTQGSHPNALWGETTSMLYCWKEHGRWESPYYNRRRYQVRPSSELPLLAGMRGSHRTFDPFLCRASLADHPTLTGRDGRDCSTGPSPEFVASGSDQLGPYFLCYHAGGLLEMSKLRRALSEGSPPHPNFFTATWAQRLKAGVILGRPGQHSLSPALPYFGTGNNGSTSS
jgi:hypothetical protein